MVEIRKAIGADCPGIAHIQVDSYRFSYNTILPDVYLAHFTYEEQEQDWRRFLSTAEEKILYVAATSTDDIIGYALGENNPDALKPFESELVAIHVQNQFQHRGLGRKLFTAVSRALFEQGNQSLFLWVLKDNPACSFYEKLGGRRITEKPWQNNKHFDTNVREVAYGWPDIKSFLSESI